MDYFSLVLGNKCNLFVIFIEVRPKLIRRKSQFSLVNFETNKEQSRSPNDVQSRKRKANEFILIQFNLVVIFYPF